MGTEVELSLVELAPRVRVWDSWPSHLSAMSRCGYRCGPLSSLLPFLLSLSPYPHPLSSNFPSPHFTICEGEGMKMGEPALPLTIALWRVGSAPPLGNTLELALVVKAQESQL